ncbi:acyl-CoA dehydrogenase family protein [Streptomyces sp. MB22_4]|uniref:acyl-CoA dehydrogenase family protein n=1 Tax=unclassified Streptomyces TaxID=2593676 RepID=UPI0024A0BDA9|nr:acyl-CoA dehydrogenase family protein [Streptomyces hygroscopicus]GLX49283.1 acyl-CoA dehydrogenase [Streptomyces hygroscopicus subsp. hygroscopicus]
MKRTLFEAEHEDYRESVRAFIAKHVVPHYADWDKAGIVPRELFTGLGALGALGIAVPEEFGGAGIQDFRYNTILHEEGARVGAIPAILGPTLHADVCLPYFLDQTDDEQKARWLPGIASGELITAVAMTEPGTGSDLSGIRTKAVRDGDHYVIDGAKTFITNGINADLVVVAVRTGEHPHRGLSLIVVERGTPGFERGRKLEKVGLHAQDTAELVFTGARVPAANLLGEEGEGFFALTRNLAQERMSVAIAGLAQAAAAFEWTVEYVRERKAFGKPIGTLQVIRHRLAELSTEIEVAQHYLDRCVLALNSGELTVVDAAKAKWWCTELQGRVMDACVQLHGGYGYMLEYPIARAWQDSRVSRIYAGTTEIMKEIIGRSLELG